MKEQGLDQPLGTPHELHVHDPLDWVGAAADVLEQLLESAIAERGLATFALSGGGTPAPVFAELASRNIDWSAVTLVQVDERIADLDSGERNLVDQQRAFADTDAAWLVLPVEDVSSGSNIEAACAAFNAKLQAVAGTPAILDVVHLGLGDDGHTASLVPGDPILDVVDADIAVTELYRGTRRLSLTYPILNRARSIVWLAAGGNKAEPLQGLLEYDNRIPAGRIDTAKSIVIVDTPALGV